MPNDTQMHFTHNHATREKMQAAGDGAFSTQFRSYVADGETALQDSIHGNQTREQVMEGVRANLLAEMLEENARSERDANAMRNRHLQLHAQMVEALDRAKEATREQKKNEALLLVEESKRDTERATTSEDALAALIREKSIALNANRILFGGDTAGAALVRAQLGGTQQQKAATANREEVTQEELDKQQEDLERLRSMHQQAHDNTALQHGKSVASLFRAMGKSVTRSSLRGRIEENKRIAREKTEFVRSEAQRWNEIREREHEKMTFRQHYHTYDRAAASLKVLGGSIDEQHSKKIKEYVGVFDVTALTQMLEELPANPYMNARRLDITSKRAVREGSANEQADNIKTHKKITMLSEAGADGLQRRYKLNSDFTGFEASRQYHRVNGRTVLDDRPAVAVARRLLRRDEMHLEIDEMDAGEGAEKRRLYSAANLEIIQVNERKWFNARTVNGVFLFGRFISADRTIAASGGDPSLLKIDVKKLRQKEQVRRAILKSNVFRLINSKTIQHMAGYGAGDNAEKYRDAVIEDIAKKTLPANTELDTHITAIKDELFSAAYDTALMADTTQLPAGSRTATWADTLLNGTEEEKKEITSGMKAKVLFDVLCQCSAGDPQLHEHLLEDGSRQKALIEAVKDDRTALKHVAKLLLAQDNKPEYWDIARSICKDVLGKRFKKALELAKATNGQIMRVALLDELNADRSLLNADDLIGAIMPTSWKQGMDDVAGERGFKAMFKQKLIDGTVQGLAGSLVGSVIGVAKGVDKKGIGFGHTGTIIKDYTDIVTMALNINLPVKLVCSLGSDLLGKDKVTTDKDGNPVHSNDTRRMMITESFSMVQDVCGIIKALYKGYKINEKRSKAGYEDLDTQSIIGPYLQIALKCISLLSSIVGSIGAIGDYDALQTITGFVKDGLSFLENLVAMFDAGYRRGKITSTEESFKSAIEAGSSAMATDTQREKMEIITGNSQLQYGLACAKAKAKNDQVKAGFGMAKSGSKIILRIVKKFVPGGKKNPITKVADATVGTLISATQIITEMARTHALTKDNIAMLLGEKFRDVDSDVLNAVLQREVGIVSKDYLTDLARIFMSINTHVFIQEAATDQEKSIGAQVAQALVYNENITTANMKKIDVSKLMGVMGVDGNFHTILKHALVFRPAI